MKSILKRRHFSRNTLIEMCLLGVIVAILIFWQFDFVNSVYFQNQLTHTGIALNSAIILLFGLGVLRIIWLLFDYAGEEAAVLKVIGNIEQGLEPLSAIAEERIIARRYRVMEQLHKSNTPINHNAMASTLLASESTRNSFPDSSTIFSS